jgi:peptidoglycan hydrolase-like protein with peptidoglycan-binding domain
LLGEADRKRVQAGLAFRGFDAGNLDGSFGPRTRRMIAAFQRSRAEVDTGYRTYVRVRADVPRAGIERAWQ